MKTRARINRDEFLKEVHEVTEFELKRIGAREGEKYYEEKIYGDVLYWMSQPLMMHELERIAASSEDEVCEEYGVESKDEAMHACVAFRLVQTPEDLREEYLQDEAIRRARK